MLESATLNLIENKSNKKVELARIYEHEGDFFDRLNKDHVKDRMSRFYKTREHMITKMKKGSTTRPEVIEYYEALFPRLIMIIRIPKKKKIKRRNLLTTLGLQLR